MYSVDTKLAEIMTNGTFLNSMNLMQQRTFAPGVKALSDRTSDLNNHPRMGQQVSSTRAIGNSGDGPRRMTWNERLEELKCYKEANGHCDVPQIYDSGLGTWVSAQRSQYKRFSMGKTSSMTAQRKESLQKLGFSWSLRKRYSWDERFAELRSFSEANQGSCEVPNEGIYKPLWAWCQNQKQGYRRGFEGKGPVIPAERVAMMERIGFRWATGSAIDSDCVSTSADSGSLIPTSDSEDDDGVMEPSCLAETSEIFATSSI